MVLSEASAVLVEDLETLLGELRKYGINIYQLLRCVNPEFCGTDTAEDSLTPGRDKNGRQVVIIGEKVYIHDPRATNQRGFLFGRVRMQARHKRPRCSECRLAGITCPIAEDTPFDRGDEPRVKRAAPPSPAIDPVELSSLNEELKLAYDAATPEQRQIMNGLILGYTFEDMAPLLHKKPATLRQSMRRLRTKLARLFGGETR